jgi:hypothetical protein
VTSGNPHSLRPLLCGNGRKEDCCGWPSKPLRVRTQCCTPGALATILAVGRFAILHPKSLRQSIVGHDLSLYVYITLIYRESSEQQLGEDQMSRNYSSTIVAVPSCLKYFRFVDYLFFDGFRRLADVRWEFSSSKRKG